MSITRMFAEYVTKSKHLDDEGVSAIALVFCLVMAGIGLTGAVYFIYFMGF